MPRAWLLQDNTGPNWPMGRGCQMSVSQHNTFTIPESFKKRQLHYCLTLQPASWGCYAGTASIQKPKHSRTAARLKWLFSKCLYCLPTPSILGNQIQLPGNSHRPQKQETDAVGCLHCVRLKKKRTSACRCSQQAGKREMPTMVADKLEKQWETTGQKGSIQFWRQNKTWKVVCCSIFLNTLPSFW